MILLAMREVPVHFPSVAGRYQSRSEAFNETPVCLRRSGRLGRCASAGIARIDHRAAVAWAAPAALSALELGGCRRSTGYTSNHRQPGKVHRIISPFAHSPIGSIEAVKQRLNAFPTRMAPEPSQIKIARSSRLFSPFLRLLATSLQIYVRLSS